MVETHTDEIYYHFFHWGVHKTVTHITEMLMTMSHKSLNLLFEVPGSFWCKQRNLYVIFIRKKEKAIVTHFCSQFSFFFKSPQTGTTSGRYWVGGSKGINQLYFISCPTQVMIVKHSVSHHVQIPYRLKTEASIVLQSILWWKSNRLNEMNTSWGLTFPVKQSKLFHFACSNPSINVYQS